MNPRKKSGSVRRETQEPLSALPPELLPAWQSGWAQDEDEDIEEDEEEKEARAAAKEAERLRKQKEKEEKERRKREAGPSWIQRKIDSLTKEIFSDDDMK